MSTQSGEVWVFAEQEEGKLASIAFELLGKARELADKLGVKVGAVLMGSGVEALSKELFAGGADVVHLVEDRALAGIERHHHLLHGVFIIMSVQI